MRTPLRKSLGLPQKKVERKEDPPVKVSKDVRPLPSENKEKRTKKDRHKRLPDSSLISCRYDAVSALWEGILLVPGAPEFKCKKKSVYTLLSALDTKYRVYLEKEGTK